MPEQRFFTVLDDLRDCGLSPLVAPYAYRRASACEVDPLAAFHKGGFVQSAGSADEEAVLYVALHRSDAEQAMLCDVAEDHVGVAEAFGYPVCCANAFAAGLTGNGYDLSVVDRTGPFDSLLNPATRYINRVRPIFHFPCWLDCQASRALAHDGQADLTELSPRLAAFADLGAGILVSRPGVGLFWYVREHDDGQAFNLVHALAQVETPLTPERKATITVEASDNFAINDVWCKEPGDRCAEFSTQDAPEPVRTSVL